ncbi:hypothetical protein [Mycobacterium novum]
MSLPDVLTGVLTGGVLALCARNVTDTNPHPVDGRGVAKACVAAVRIAVTGRVAMSRNE